MYEQNYKVNIERLKHARSSHFINRYIANLVTFILLLFSKLIVDIFNGNNKKSTNLSKKILLTGRFESYNWFNAHIRPIKNSIYCQTITIIADKELKIDEKIRVICPPMLLSKIVGKSTSRLLYFAYISVKERPDILGGFHLLCNGLAAILMAKIIRSKSIYFCVGGWSEVIGGGAYSGTTLFGDTGIDDKIKEFLLIHILQQCDYIITMGSKARKYFKTCKLKNVYTIPGGIDDRNFFTILNNSPKKDIDLLLVARLDPIKRIDIFIKIVKQIKRKIDKVSAIVVGSGPLMNNLKELIIDENLDNNLKLVGFQTNIRSWLNRSKILVVTSESEGLPLSIMEAMTLGLPIITSNVGDIKDVVENNAVGFLVEFGFIDAYCEGIFKLLNNKKRYDEFSKNALRKSKDFTLHKATELWNEILN